MVRVFVIVDTRCSFELPIILCDATITMILLEAIPIRMRTNMHYIPEYISACLCLSVVFACIDHATLPAHFKVQNA